MLAAMAYKFKLILNDDERQKLSFILGSLRFLYNSALAEREGAYRQMLLHGHITNKYLSVKLSGDEKALALEINSAYKVDRFSQDAEFRIKELKKNPHLSLISFLGDIPSGPAQQKLADLDKAFGKFFAKTGGYPHFKSKSSKDDSMRFSDPRQFIVVPTTNTRTTRNGIVRVKGCGVADLPKIGKLRFLQTRVMEFSKLNSITISQEGKDYFISINVESEKNLPKAENQHDVLGIDRNGNGDATLALSSGKLIAGPYDQLVCLEDRIAVLQARMRNKKKGSVNYKKSISKINKLHTKKTRTLRDWQQKTTTMIAKSHSIVALEKLHIKGMTASAKGTVDEPGRNTAAKSGLNKLLLRFGHGEIARQLHYKVSWRKGHVVLVNAHYTSQTCSVCGERHNTVRIGREFECHNCGICLDADLNASENIKQRAERFLAGQDNLLPGESAELLASVCDTYVASKLKRGSRNQLRAEKRKLLVSSKPDAA